MDLLIEMPCWYWIIAIFFSSYQGIRGGVEHRLNHTNKLYAQNKDNQWGWIDPREPEWKPWEAWLVLYVHDFIYRFICSMAGFISLYACYFTLSKTSILALSTGSSALIAFLFIVGVIGVGGQLHYAILFGKVPR